MASLCPGAPNPLSGELANRDPGERPGDHVAGKVDTGVHARVGDHGGERPQRDCGRGGDVGDAGRERERCSAVPGGNEREVGIGTWRASGTSPCGRRRRAASLKPRFTTAEVAASEASPVPAARRPAGPPASASAAAAASESFE